MQICEPCLSKIKLPLGFGKRSVNGWLTVAAWAQASLWLERPKFTDLSFRNWR